MPWVSTWEELLEQWRKIWEENPPELKPVSKTDVLIFEELVRKGVIHHKETHEEPPNKGQLKYVKWSLIVGGYAFCLKTLGNVVKERDDETTRANTMSAMFGSLAEYVGEDVVTAWEDLLGAKHASEDEPVQAPDNEDLFNEALEAFKNLDEETEMDNDSYLQEPMPEDEKAAELEEGEAIEIVAPMEGVDVTPAADADDASEPSRDENNG